MFIVFDLDGTLRDVSHRRKYVAGPQKDYREFFRQSVHDTPIQPVIDLLRNCVMQGHRVEIWSGCSDEVISETEDWLNRYIKQVHISEPGMETYTVYGASLLKHMRPSDDHRPDTVLKNEWLNAEATKPDMIFDDRQSVVDMWRANGVVCAQVAPGDFDKKNSIKLPPRRPKLTVMIGPSGSGKSFQAWKIIAKKPYCAYVSSDDTREAQFEGFNDEAYTPAGFNHTFSTTHALLSAYLRGGIDVIYDATNLRRRNRMELLKFLDFEADWFDVEYIVVSRGLASHLVDYFEFQPDHTNESILRKHYETFQSSKHYALAGDGFDRITVINMITGE